MSDEKLSYLIDHYSSSVLRLAYSYLKNIQDAEDVCQSVFIKMYHLNKEFIDTEHEKAYILHITANSCKNVLKSAWRKKIVDVDNLPELSVSEIDDDNIWHVVNELDEKYRTIIYLHYHDGYKVDEISKILGTKPATIKTRLARGRACLKKLLGGNYGQ